MYALTLMIIQVLSIMLIFPLAMAEDIHYYQDSTSTNQINTVISHEVNSTNTDVIPSLSSMPVQSCPSQGVSISLADLITLGSQRSARQNLNDNYTLQIEETRLAKKEFLPRFSIIGSKQRNHSEDSSDPNNFSQSGSSSYQAGIQASVKSPIGTSLTTSYGYVANTLTYLNQTSSSHNALQLNLSQPLLRNAGLRIGMANFKSAERQQYTNTIQHEINITKDIINLVNIYLNALSAFQHYQIALKGLETTQLSLKSVQNQVSAGILAQADLRQMALNVAQRELDVSITKTSYDSALTELAIQIGCSGTTDLKIANIAVIDNPNEHFGLDIQINTIPEIILSEIILQDAEENVYLARNGTLPNLSLNVSLTKNIPINPTSVSTETSAIPLNKTYTIGLQMEIPLNDYDARFKLSSARVKRTQAQRMLEQLRTDTIIRIRDSVRTIESNREQVIFTQKQLDYATQFLDDENAKLKAGRSSILQLQTAQSNIVNAQISKNNALINLFRAKLNYFSLIGSLQSFLSNTENYVR